MVMAVAPAGAGALMNRKAQWFVRAGPRLYGGSGAWGLLALPLPVAGTTPQRASAGADGPGDATRRSNRRHALPSWLPRPSAGPALGGVRAVHWHRALEAKGPNPRYVHTISYSWYTLVQ